MQLAYAQPIMNLPYTGLSLSLAGEHASGEMQPSEKRGYLPLAYVLGEVRVEFGEISTAFLVHTALLCTR